MLRVVLFAVELFAEMRGLVGAPAQLEGKISSSWNCLWGPKIPSEQRRNKKKLSLLRSSITE